MSFKGKQKNRRKKVARQAAQKSARRSGSSSSGWWLTLVRRKGCCNSPTCGRILKVGDEAVYRHTPREILCVRCAERRGLFARPSVKWEEKHGRKARTGPAWIRNEAA